MYKRITGIFILALFLQFAGKAQVNLTIHPKPPQGIFYAGQFRMQRNFNRPKIGLVLSGGGARGLAQIGVLRILEQHHIPIDLIVGNSLGSVIGGLYASGYTTRELDSITTNVNWDELLSFSEESNRSDLFVAQKQGNPNGYLSVRLEGLQPILPQSISGGQHLTNFFMNLTLQALYHPDSTFDDLKIPFRSIATDLNHGRRVILDRGSLAEAMRASVTVPFLYTPLDRDSMALVDGGLLSNIPVDVARSMGCDIVIVVNSTSDLRRTGHFAAPWEVADQIMTIMMQTANQIQLKNADVVITPDLNGHAVSDFSGIDTLIYQGEVAAQLMVDSISTMIKAKSTPFTSRYGNRVFTEPALQFLGDPAPDTIRAKIETLGLQRRLGIQKIEESITGIYSTGQYADVSCAIRGDSAGPASIVYTISKNPLIRHIGVTGVHSLPPDRIDSAVIPLQGKTFNVPALGVAVERILREYRAGMYSLARIDSVQIDSAKGEIHIAVNEGVLCDIKFDGNEKTKDYVIRRELPYDAGGVFNLRSVYSGMVNVASTGLFDYVLLDVRYRGQQPYVVLKVKEKPSETLLLGLHGDNEHGLVSTVNLVNSNFRGAGDELGLLLRYGLRDRQARLDYRANRIFRTYFTFDLKTFFYSRDIFTYMDAPGNDETHWDRIEQGRYRDNWYGGVFSFGSQVERLGSVTIDLGLAHHHIDPISGAGYTADSYTIPSVKLQTTLDTENKFVFPTEGLFFNGYYEWSSKSFGSDVPFSKIGCTYESYYTIASRHTIHPRFTFGFADNTLPISEQYHVGGYTSFFGLNEDDSRGRQLFLINMEYRYFAPFRLLFDTYLGIRYDLGTISATPEDLKFSTFRHGVGATVSLDTPLGAASFGAGFSFFFHRNLPNDPLSTGPMMLYFSIGPSIY